MDLEHPLLAIGSTAIHGESSCGINAKYEPSFEALEAELAKQESLNAETVDWKEVKALATDLLQNTTKDFLVASYLTHALTITEGYTGLLVGIKILESFTENYWQESFPPAKRLRARKTAIEWMVEKTNNYLEQSPPTSKENEIIIEIAKLTKNLDFALSEKMESQAPTMSDLNRSLKRLKQSAEFEVKEAKLKEAPPVAEAVEEVTTITPTSIAEQPLPVEPPTPEPAATIEVVQPITTQSTQSQSAQASKAATVNSGPIGSATDAKKLYKQVQDALRQLAEFHAAEKLSDPKRYRYSRSALWDSLDKLPPNKDNKTQLPKPPADKFKKLQELFEQGDFTSVINQAEKSAAKMPYWFDGQRLIASSLESLGGEYSKSSQALIDELKQFITRIPAIINLCYSDGTPFADEQTQMWLTTQVLTSSEASDGNATDLLDESFKDAQKLAANGKLDEGLTLLKNIPTHSIRDSYRTKIAGAELVAQSGQVKVAIPLLERLTTETKKISALDWETDLTIKAYSILVQAYDKLEEADAELKQNERSLAFEQLCWFDPTAVIN